MATQSDDLTIQTLPILFSDVNELLGVLNSLTDNYRLLVGAAEELTRIPGVTQESINYALDRIDNTGILIDLVIFTLAIKLDFVTEVLNATALPLDLVISLFAKAIKAREENPPRDPDNLLPRPRNPYRTEIKGNTLKSFPITRDEKWKYKQSQWEKRKKKLRARKMIKRSSSLLR